ncbi:hypothetical protein [Blastopirellula marina]|uniref:Uncharacterized protein n=1 Tax=Blastopirellula marina TaxID=124 RepID=A0A2S8GM24_9BACT|nr:hypothetical protein [Blastopirellula marina]PQO45487.1 hypothetical protein C5Y93_13630 [Blastopirellula marina]
MKQTDPKWHLLGVMLLSLCAIMIPRWFQGRAYSGEEAYRIFNDIFARYNVLNEAKASSEAWKAWQVDATSQLSEIVMDHEANTASKTPASTVIHQMAKYELPQLPQQERGSANKELLDNITLELTATQEAMAPVPKKAPKRNTDKEQG